MATRYFNWKLATVLMVALVVFTASAYALHQWQKNSRAIRSLSLGQAAYAAGNWDEAAVQLGNYIGVNGGSVEILLKYADAQRKRRPLTSGIVQLALGTYREVLRLDPGNREATQNAMEMYLTLMHAPGDAKLLATNFLKNHDDPVIHRMLVDALVQLLDTQGAATELTAILDKHPEDVLAYAKMGQLAEQYRTAVNKPAESWFDAAIAANPQSALAYIARAEFRLRQNNSAGARADLAQAQKCDLSDTDTRLRLATALMRRGVNDLDQAREHLKVVQTQDPTSQLLWQRWADLASRAGSTDEMYKVAQDGLKALSTQPWDFMPIAAELLIRSDHVEEANGCITRMRQKDIAPPATAYLEGLAAEKQGRLRDAIGSWRNALTLGYRQPVIYVKLASALSRLGDTQSAIGQLQSLLTDAPNYLEGHLFLAQLLMQAQDWAGVLGESLQIQQLSPGQSDAVVMELQARTRLLATDRRPAAEREKAWQEIETRLAQLLKKAGDKALAIKLLQAQVALIRGRFAEARSMLTDLESRYPSEIKVLLLRADLCAAEGKNDEAKTRFEDAVTRAPQSFDPVRGLALFLNRQNQREECEAVIKAAMARIQEPRARRDLGLMLSEFYRQWKQDEKLTEWLKYLAAQFPNDVQPRRLLLTRPEIAKDPAQMQSLVDEIHKLEGDSGWQWKYEQARLWYGTSGSEFKAHYPQIVKLLQENLLAHPKDHASRLLLGDTYQKANELQLAVATYREALGFLPNSVPVLVRMVHALNQVKEYDEARSLLDRAEQQNLDDPDLRALRLQDDVRRGEYAAAGEALEKMVSQDPNDTNSSLNLALVRMREKKYDEAQKILDGLKTQAPDSMSVLAAQLSLYVQEGKADEAIRLCNQVVDKLHNAAAYTLRARTYIALKDHEKVLEDLGRIIALDPKKAESWAARADYYRMIGRVRDGISDIKQALSLAPDNSVIQRLAAMLFVASGDLSLIGEAETLLDQALAPYAKSPPTDAQDPRMPEYTGLRLLKAQVLVLRGTGPGVEEARAILREITDNQPKVAQAWQLRAQLELSQEDPSKAWDITLRGLAHNPENGPLLLLKAQAEKMRSPAMAALTLKGLLEQKPDNVEVAVELADAYIRAGRSQQAVDLLKQKLSEFQGRQRRRCEIAYAEALYANGQRDEAKSRFDTLMQAEPNDPTPTMTLAQQLRRERRWTEMNQLVRRWISEHPTDAAVATTIARVLAATGDKQALQVGEDILRQILERNPQSVSSLMLLAMMMQDVGRYEESERLNREVLEIDPNSVIAINNLAWVLCETDNSPDRYREALALAERGLKIAPDYVDLLDTRGYAHYRLGEVDQAVSDFVRCTRLYPENSPSGATPLFHLALTYAQIKHKAEAEEQLRMALNANLANFRLAREQAESGRVTYAIKVLKDALQLQERMEPLKATLNLPGQNGPSTEEVEEAKALLERLQKGNY